MSEPLNEDEKQILLRLAREAIVCAVEGKALPALDRTTLTPALRDEGASFVTLTIQGRLRGCIGAIEPYQSLVDDVREHAIAAALEDFRFPTVQASELDKIEIEISRLTFPQQLEYSDGKDLLEKLRPHVDGVIIKDGYQRATFLPQVWEKIPDKTKFMDELCFKMGAAPDIWRKKHLDVLTYQVEEFCE
jgi:AmmeMemoRadiSam system protein A